MSLKTRASRLILWGNQIVSGKAENRESWLLEARELLENDELDPAQKRVISRLVPQVLAKGGEFTTV